MTVFEDVKVDSSTVSQNNPGRDKILDNFHERLVNDGLVFQ